MPSFTKENTILIKTLYKLKGYNAKQLAKQFVKAFPRSGSYCVLKLK